MSWARDDVGVHGRLLPAGLGDQGVGGVGGVGILLPALVGFQELGHGTVSLLGGHVTGTTLVLYGEK